MKNESASSLSPQALLDELKGFVSEAEAMIAGPASRVSADVLDTLRTRFDAAQARFAHGYQDARKHVVDGARSTDVAIRENPYRSLAIVLGLGLLVGVLVGRRGT